MASYCNVLAIISINLNQHKVCKNDEVSNVSKINSFKILEEEEIQMPNNASLRLQMFPLLVIFYLPFFHALYYKFSKN